MSDDTFFCDQSGNVIIIIFLSGNVIIMNSFNDSVLN